MNTPFTPRDGNREFEDPRLQSGIRALLADSAPAPGLVARVERMARSRPHPAAVNPWAERLPAFASLGLLLAMLIGALNNLPIGPAIAELMGGPNGFLAGSPLILVGMSALVLGTLATIDWLCGAPMLRRFNR